MTAVLKKRAVAEFTHVLQEEEKLQPPPKKLRLTYQPKQTELQLDLNKCLTTAEVFQALHILELSLPLPTEQVQPAVGVLFEHFRKEIESAVRARVAHLLSILCRAPTFNAAGLVDDIKDLLKNESSCVVKSQLIGVLVSIGQIQPANVRLNKLLVDFTFKYLNDLNYLVRRKTLQLIGSLGSPDHQAIGQNNSQMTALSVLESFTHEPDCRVRMHAFQSMLTWHQRGLRLGQSVYSEACLALTDDFEGVRLTAVKLVWVLSELYPNVMVNLPQSNEPIRMVDDGFANICNMVNDISMNVRAESVRLLGSLHAVNPRFLEQTLDKKLMSNMRRKRSAHERQKDFFESGEWSTGQKWADDAPKEDTDPDSISLISNGACGAFVHGLEDEYLEVRNATIDSLCELAAHSPSFAKLSQDFLVDMFNDEIESVRLNAINSLRKICHHFLLREDQLEIILSVLKDFNFEIREALRDMLSSCRLSTKTCLNIIVTLLLDNMTRYSEDKQSIWKCMVNVGKHHSSLVLSMAPQLLSTHPYFESIEPDVHDPAYTSILILIFNAALHCPTMEPLFPDYISRHYTYLRDILPELVPSLQQFSGLVKGSSAVLIIKSSSAGKTMTILSQILSRLEGLQFMDRNSAIQLMKIAIRHLQKVDHLEPELSASAQCIGLHLKCQLYLDKAISKSGNICNVLRSQHDISLLTTLISNVLDLTSQMEHQFVGISLMDLVQIRQLCLTAMTLQLLSQLQQSNVNNDNVKSLCRHFLRYLDQLQQLILISGSSTDAFMDSLLSELTILNSSCESERYQEILMTSLHLNKPMLLKLSNNLQKAHFELVEPMNASDTTIKLIAGLIAPVTVVGFVKNVTRLDRLRIQVRYPDQQTHFVLPPLSDFRQLNTLHHKLITKVLLSHVLWSEPCPVELCIVMLCSNNIDEKIDGSSKDSSTAHIIQLCRPVSVMMSPIAPRKSS